jgi:hypothetical protein
LIACLIEPKSWKFGQLSSGVLPTPHAIGRADDHLVGKSV